MATKVNRASCNSGSVVWNYFDLDESRGRVSCRECKQQLCYNRNTSAMREHLKLKKRNCKLLTDWSELLKELLNLIFR
jgi:hypothetical protein